MTREAFAELVRRVEERYRARPAALERSVARWARLGLAALLSWVAFLTGLGLALLAAGAAAPAPLGPILVVAGAALAIYGALQAGYLLSGEAAPPEGRAVAPGEAPALTGLIDRLRGELQCPPFDEVRITADLNAGVRGAPRLGLPGRGRTSLEIGLPLARALAPDEFTAVLAHELGHHFGRHGRSAGLVHRLDRTWGALSRQMARPAVSSFARTSRAAVSRFVAWYWPRLHARTLVLSRAHEHQADLDAARLAGGEALATALWRLELLNPWLADRTWPAILAGAAERPEPPDDVLDRLTTAIRTPPPAADAAAWAERGLVRATLHDETHPALLDRVKAMGVDADALRRIGFPAAASPSAADVYLGDLDREAARELSAAWRKEALGVWRDRHRKAAAEARRRPKPAAEPAAADVQELWESACRATEIQGLDACVPLFRRVLEVDPEHGGANVAVGRSLAAAGDPEGEAMLLRVLERNDADWVSGACEALRTAYRAAGRRDALREIDARLDRHEAAMEAARRERSTVRAGDAFIPHDLDEDAVARLAERLAGEPDLDAAWLVRKKLEHFPGRPLFVLCVRGAVSRWGRTDADREQALVRRLVSRVDLPGQVLVVSPSGSFRTVAKVCMKSPGSQVYRRDARPPGPQTADPALA